MSDAKPRPTGIWQLLKFLVVGGLNTLFSTVVFWVGIYFGLPYYWATAVALLAGIVTGFKAHSRWVFATRGHAFWYLLSNLLIYAVNTLSIAAVRPYVGDYWAPLLMLPITVPVTFLIFKKLVFRGA
jgi:putative flippase GtrA